MTIDITAHYPVFSILTTTTETVCYCYCQVEKTVSSCVGRDLNQLPMISVISQDKRDLQTNLEIWQQPFIEG